ncbi:MAG: magnesium/cobalt transporter CorA [Verrucomicrobiales bacterium]|nr:magnesium/cobalt transporter CorA [Verrucomicrobiales bacterium]
MAIRKLFPKIGFSNKRKHLAQPPGSLVHFGTKRVDRFQIRSMRFDEAALEENDDQELENVVKADPDLIDFHEVVGLHEVKKISALAELFSLNSLLVEDILNTGSRPKIEKRDDVVFVICKLVTHDGQTNEVDVQQCSFVLLPNNVLLTFLEGPTSAFNPVRERIRTGAGGRIRRFDADYLLWALLDAVVDNYLYVIDVLDRNIFQTEEQLQENPDKITTEELYTLKRDVGQLYRTIRPIREISTVLTRPGSPLLTETSEPFFTDLNDHVIQVVETTEDLRESAGALREFHLSMVSHRMNEVMKVLTCFSTIFLPMTFLAGIYGMNFEYIPELSFRWGYPALWGVFLVAAGVMIWLFRKKKWI